MEQIADFKFDIPTRIEFGNQVFKKLGKLCRGYGNKALVISYKDRSLHAFVEECVFLLKAENKAKSEEIRIKEIETGKLEPDWVRDKVFKLTNN